MSLKAVELQVAIPRTLEVSRIQEHQQQRSMHEQQSMIDQRRDLDEHMRQRPSDIEQSQKNQIREREKKQGQQDHKDNKESTNNQTSESSEGVSANADLMRDPLRGRIIDISL
ncbi:hypothetical protein [Brevibacillus fortis]|uniref:RNA polymerase subunit sigma n=1 Tax=Brevibacillus fortis TaxID=2126352 RepID=A0A2P7V0S6_9BACL|nr:hypothetical protein [Brevibacillus fortis]PSJ92820.1 hypothetical protein C7R93_19100 [Brevibacillus fortis]